MYSVSIGLLHHDQPVLGVVYEVNRDECFYAARGQGAFCNGSTLKVSTLDELSQSVLATGYPQINFDRLPHYLNVLGDLMQQTHGIRRMGSAAVDLAYVACGRVSGFFEYNLNVYDVAAGVVLVQEAGGTITDFKGGQDYLWGREILAANGVHAALLQQIQNHWS
jgi:myo-inositol-1(or 4)-monophosphatase